MLEFILSIAIWAALYSLGVPIIWVFVIGIIIGLCINAMKVDIR